jgi:hypothetical protein
MTKPVEFQVGFTSPPIGFVHFGEPEEEPRSYLDEYLMAMEDGLEELDDDELRVGFTAADIF